MTDQGDDKWLLETKCAGDGEDGIQTGEHGSKENHPAHPRVDREIGKMVAKGSELFIICQSRLREWEKTLVADTTKYIVTCNKSHNTVHVHVDQEILTLKLIPAKNFRSI